MTVPTVSLVLHEADSLRVLRSALESAARLNRDAAGYHVATGKLRAQAGDTSEANRHKRVAAEYQRRVALAQQLADQLPDPKATP